MPDTPNQWPNANKPPVGKPPVTNAPPSPETVAQPNAPTPPVPVPTPVVVKPTAAQIATAQDEVKRAEATLAKARVHAAKTTNDILVDFANPQDFNQTQADRKRQFEKRCAQLADEEYQMALHMAKFRRLK